MFETTIPRARGGNRDQPKFLRAGNRLGPERYLVGDDDLGIGDPAGDLFGWRAVENLELVGKADVAKARLGREGIAVEKDDPSLIGFGCRHGPALNPVPQPP
jgi:hypothetical protein